MVTVAVLVSVDTDSVLEASASTDPATAMASDSPSVTHTAMVDTDTSRQTTGELRNSTKLSNGACMGKKLMQRYCCRLVFWASGKHGIASNQIFLTARQLPTCLRRSAGWQVYLPALANRLTSFPLFQVNFCRRQAGNAATRRFSNTT